VNTFTIDTTPPTLSEVTAVPTPTSDNTSNYTFSSSEAGTITYAGNCSSTDNTSIAGNNEITFNALSDGTHSNCKIKVTDVYGNESSNLDVASFITPVPPLSNDNASSYTFYSTLSGAISYGGGCDSDNETASVDNNTVTFNALADGTYNCTITVTNSGSGLASEPLSVRSFTIDTTPPSLSEVPRLCFQFKRGRNYCGRRKLQQFKH